MGSVSASESSVTLPSAPGTIAMAMLPLESRPALPSSSLTCATGPASAASIGMPIDSMNLVNRSVACSALRSVMTSGALAGTRSSTPGSSAIASGLSPAINVRKAAGRRSERPVVSRFMPERCPFLATIASDPRMP